MAHKVILSACSPFFRNILRRNSHQHPLLYLKGVKYRELLAVLNFMYQGEVSVAQEELNIFLTVAEDLRVKGLTQSKQPTTPSNINTKTNKPTENTQPQFKRSRLGPSSTPVVTTKRSTHSVSTYNQEPEVEEYVPVKVEPRDPAQQTFQIQPEPSQLQDQEGGDQTEGLSGYDYQYTGEVYPHNTVTETTNDNSNKDLESLIFSKMSKNTNGEWQCTDCYKASKVKTNIYVHIEANHVDSPGYQCDVCYKFCTTSNALRKHKFVKHRNEEYNYQ